MDAAGLVAVVLPELDALKGVGQNPYHHLDVWGHTLEVLRQLLDLERGPRRGFRGARRRDRPRSCERPLADELTRGEALRFGALFHDIGKPGTRTVSGRSRDVHGARSARRADQRGDRQAAARVVGARRVPRGAGPSPPAARLPRARAPAAARPRLRVPQRLRAGRGRGQRAVGRRPAGDRGRQDPRRGRRGPPRPGPRAAGGGARVARRGAAAAAAERRRADGRARHRRRGRRSASCWSCCARASTPARSAIAPRRSSWPAPGFARRSDGAF